MPCIFFNAIRNTVNSRLARKRTPSGIGKSVRCPLTRIIPTSGRQRKIGWMSTYGKNRRESTPQWTADRWKFVKTHSHRAAALSKGYISVDLQMKDKVHCHK